MWRTSIAKAVMVIDGSFALCALLCVKAAGLLVRPFVVSKHAVASVGNTLVMILF